MHGVHAFSFVMAGTMEKGVQIVGLGGNDWNAVGIDGRGLAHAW